MAEAVQVGDGGKMQKAPRRFFVVVLIVVMVLAAAAGGAVRWLISRNKVDNTPGSSARLPAQIEDVQNLRLSGDAADAAKKIDQSLADPSASPETKYMLYIQKGNIAADAKNWQVAIDAYVQAEAIKKTYEVTNLLADSYKAMGDKAKAIEYYKKLIVLIPQSPISDDLKATYEQQVRDLGGQP